MTKYQGYINEIADLKVRLAEAKKATQLFSDSYNQRFDQVQKLKQKLASIRELGVEEIRKVVIKNSSQQYNDATVLTVPGVVSKAIHQEIAKRLE